MSTQNSPHPMLRRNLALGAAAIALFAGAAAVHAQATAKGSTKRDPTRSLIHVDANHADYKEVMPGISRAVIYGDPNTGPYAAFTKFQPGQHNPLHFHSNPIRLVVLRGAYIYEPQGGETIRVGAGQFINIPAKAPHVSGGDPKDGALFYEESTGKFDTHYIEHVQQTGRLEQQRKY